MLSIVIPSTTMRLIQAGLAAAEPEDPAAGLFNGALIKLFQNDITPTKATALADLHVATFTGYANSSAVVWGAPLTDENGVTTVTGGSKQFTASDGVVPNTIYGWYATNAGGSVLLFSCRYDEPIEINSAADGVVVLPEFNLRAA